MINTSVMNYEIIPLNSTECSQHCFTECCFEKSKLDTQNVIVIKATCLKWNTKTSLVPLDTKLLKCILVALVNK